MSDAALRQHQEDYVRLVNKSVTPRALLVLAVDVWRGTKNMGIDFAQLDASGVKTSEQVKSDVQAVALERLRIDYGKLLNGDRLGQDDVDPSMARMAGIKGAKSIWQSVKEFELDISELDPSDKTGAKGIFAKLNQFSVDNVHHLLKGMNVVKKGSDYRIHPSNPYYYQRDLERLAFALDYVLPPQEGMGQRLVRQTLVITNPTNAVKKELDAHIRQQSEKVHRDI